MIKNDEQQVELEYEALFDEDQDNGFLNLADDDKSSGTKYANTETECFEARLSHLDNTVTKHPLNREILYKTLSFCTSERSLNDIENYIESLPEFPRATQNQYHMVQTLVQAGGLDLIERDEQGTAIEPESKVGLSDDEVDDLVFSQSYIATDVGCAYVELHRPQSRLVALLHLVPERSDTYQMLLDFIDIAPRSYAEVKELLDGSPALETFIDGKRQTMQPSVFIDKLERAGALVWKEGWNLTEEGREFLKELKDKVE